MTGSMVEETVVLPLDDEDLLDRALQIHGEDLAAVILEPCRPITAF